jgi:hypothetical protein
MKFKILMVVSFSFLLLMMVFGCGKKAPEKKAPTQKLETVVNSETPTSVPKEKKEIKDSEEGNFFTQIKVKNWKDEGEEASIEDNAENVIIRDKGEVSKSDADSPVPPASMAGRIMEQDKEIEWVPKWRYHGTGGPWLPAVALSTDKSLLAIVETTGQDDGPYGSRIVFLNTYNWRVAKIIDLKRKVTKILFIPKSNLLVCQSSVQKELKQPRLLFLLNCRRGKIVSSSKIIKDDISGWDVDKDGKSLLVRMKDNKKLFIFDARRLKEAPRTVKMENTGGVVTFMPDGISAVVAGDKSLEITDLEEVDKKYPLPDGFTADSIRVLDNDKTFILGSKKQGKVLAFRSGNFEILADFATGFIFYCSSKKTLIIEQKKENALTFLSVPDLKETASFSPSAKKPKTHGDILIVAYISHCEKYLGLDNQGNCYLLYKPTKKWRKTLLFSARK